MIYPIVLNSGCPNDIIDSMERLHFRKPEFESEYERQKRIERERARRVETRQNPEMERVRQLVEHVLGMQPGDPGLPGDPGDPPTVDMRVIQLEMILDTESQRDAAGNLRYLLTSGLAVELLTGFRRSHHDLDLVIMDPENESHYWELYGTDNVTPGCYWADMQFNPKFLARTAREVRTRRKRRSPRVEVVHPGIILVQKSSDCFNRSPRPKDTQDVSAIVRYWKLHEGYSVEWNPVIRTSIDALPESQKDRTIYRVRQAVQNEG